MIMSPFGLLISITFRLKLFLMHGLHVESQVNSFLQDLSNYKTGYDWRPYYKLAKLKPNGTLAMKSCSIIINKTNTFRWYIGL